MIRINILVFLTKEDLKIKYCFHFLISNNINPKILF
jgi:hypothetical protein